jgi:hypothetical protein
VGRVRLRSRRDIPAAVCSVRDASRGGLVCIDSWELLGFASRAVEQVKLKQVQENELSRSIMEIRDIEGVRVRFTDTGGDDASRATAGASEDTPTSDKPVAILVHGFASALDACSPWASATVNVSCIIDIVTLQSDAYPPQAACRVGVTAPPEPGEVSPARVSGDTGGEIATGPAIDTGPATGTLAPTPITNGRTPRTCPSCVRMSKSPRQVEHFTSPS